MTRVLWHGGGVWESIKFITSGLSLAGFVAACIVVAWRSAVGRERKLIEAAPAEQRGALVDKALEKLTIDTGSLSPAQKSELIKRQLDLRAQGLRTTAVLIGLGTILLVGLAGYAISRTGPSVEKVDATLEKVDPNGAAKREEKTAAGALPSKGTGTLQDVNVENAQVGRVAPRAVVGGSGDVTQRTQVKGSTTGDITPEVTVTH